MCACLRVHATQVNGLTGLWFLADYIIYHIHLYLNSRVKSAVWSPEARHARTLAAPLAESEDLVGGVKVRWLRERLFEQSSLDVYPTLYRMYSGRTTERSFR